MWEPKLLARLDLIKKHLLLGDSKERVADEISDLQKDINDDIGRQRGGD